MGVCLSSQGFCPVGFVRGFLSGRFCPGWFLCVPLLSEFIHYNRKLNITFNFRFHMFEFFLKCDATCSWTTPLCHKLSHLLGRPLPSQAWRTLWTAPIAMQSPEVLANTAYCLEPIRRIRSNHRWSDLTTINTCTHKHTCVHGHTRTMHIIDMHIHTHFIISFRLFL